MRSTPSTRSSRFWLPDQRVNASANSWPYPSRARCYAQLLGERVVDLDPLVARCPAEQLLVDGVEPAELLDRSRVVVDAEVDQRVGEPGVATALLDDEQRGRLLPAPVAAGRLGGGEAFDQPLRERCPSAASNVSASASTVSPETRMLPWAAYPGPCGRPPTRGTPAR